MDFLNVKRHFIDTAFEVQDQVDTRPFLNSLMYFLDKFNNKSAKYSYSRKTSPEFIIKLMTGEAKYYQANEIKLNKGEIEMVKKMYHFYVRKLNYQVLNKMINTYHRIEKEQQAIGVIV